jgi:Fe-S cluster assembly protein SufD
MTVAVAENATIPERFEALSRQLDSGFPALRRFREEGLARFVALGFPTPEIEEWRLTSVAPIARTDFATAAGEAGPEINDVTLPAAAAELVFVGGRFSPKLSRTGALPKGVQVVPLALALAAGDPVAKRLGTFVDVEQPFAALNAALLTDGALIHIGAGVALTAPIQVAFLGVANGQPTIASARVLVVAEPGSQATIVERYAGTGRYFTNAVTEIVAGDGAVIDHYRLQNDSSEAFHVSNTHVRQMRNSSVHTHAITFGGALTRNDLDVVLDGEGASCVLDGLYLLEGSQHLDNHTKIDHVTPLAESLELYKGILDGKSRGIFDGKIIVRPGAQKTTSRQTNKNLLLTSDAIADSNPTLEIYADDVKCNHGSTIGQLDEEALFYLQSRGVGLADARNILTYAFASEIVERMKLEPVRALLARTLLERLPGSGEGAA